MWSPSPDGTPLAYGLCVNHMDATTVHVLDIDSRKISEADRIGGDFAYMSWTPSGAASTTWGPRPRRPSRRRTG